MKNREKEGIIEELRDIFELIATLVTLKMCSVPFIVH